MNTNPAIRFTAPTITDRRPRQRTRVDPSTGCPGCGRLYSGALQYSGQWAVSVASRPVNRAAPSGSEAASTHSWSAWAPPPRSCRGHRGSAHRGPPGSCRRCHRRRRHPRAAPCRARPRPSPSVARSALADSAIGGRPPAPAPPATRPDRPGPARPSWPRCAPPRRSPVTRTSTLTLASAGTTFSAVPAVANVGVTVVPRSGRRTSATVSSWWAASTRALTPFRGSRPAWAAGDHQFERPDPLTRLQLLERGEHDGHDHGDAGGRPGRCAPGDLRRLVVGLRRLAELPRRETQVPRPLSPYAVSKLAAAEGYVHTLVP